MANPIDGLLARSERKTEALRAVRDAVADDPAFLAELMRAFGVQNGSVAASGKPRKKKGKNALKIKEFFDGRSNVWATIAEIQSGTSLSKNSVVGVVYKTTPSPLEGRDHPTEPKKRQFRWKQSA